jgi:hypothetical protein
MMNYSVASAKATERLSHPYFAGMRELFEASPIGF